MVLSDLRIGSYGLSSLGKLKQFIKSMSVKLKDRAYLETDAVMHIYYASNYFFDTPRACSFAIQKITSFPIETRLVPHTHVAY